MEKKPIEIEGTTLPFVTYEKDATRYYFFDATQSSPPEPMINALRALEYIKKGEILIGLFFHAPEPLFAKIEPFFEYKVTPLTSGDVEVEFRRK